MNLTDNIQLLEAAAPLIKTVVSGSCCKHIRETQLKRMFKELFEEIGREFNKDEDPYQTYKVFKNEILQSGDLSNLQKVKILRKL